LTFASLCLILSREGVHMSIQEKKVVEISFSHFEGFCQDFTKAVIADFRSMVTRLEQLHQAGYRLRSGPFSDQEKKGDPLLYRLELEAPPIDPPVLHNNVPSTEVKLTPFGAVTEPPENTGPKPEDLRRPVEELTTISVRSYNCLKNAHIHTIGELVEKTEAEMLSINSLGRRSLNELREILQGLGLSFRKP